MEIIGERQSLLRVSVLSITTFESPMATNKDVLFTFFGKKSLIRMCS